MYPAHVRRKNMPPKYAYTIGGLYGIKVLLEPRDVGYRKRFGTTDPPSYGIRTPLWDMPYEPFLLPPLGVVFNLLSQK